MTSTHRAVCARWRLRPATTCACAEATRARAALRARSRAGGDEGTESRWPSTPGTLCEGGLGARVLGLEDALAALGEHRELELLDAPALAELGEAGY